MTSRASPSSAGTCSRTAETIRTCGERKRDYSLAVTTRPLELRVRQSVKLIVPAIAVAFLAAAPPLATASAPRHVAPPSATLAGSVLPSVAHSALLGSARPDGIGARVADPATVASGAAREAGGAVEREAGPLAGPDQRTLPAGAERPRRRRELHALARLQHGGQRLPGDVVHGQRRAGERRVRRVACELPPAERDHLPGSGRRDPPAGGAFGARAERGRALDAAARAAGGREAFEAAAARLAE